MSTKGVPMRRKGEPTEEKITLGVRLYKRQVDELNILAGVDKNAQDLVRDLVHDYLKTKVV